MATRANPFIEVARMLPKLALIAAFLTATALAVSSVNAAPEAVSINAMLVGGEIAKPSGVGFVLAVGLQRRG